MTNEPITVVHVISSLGQGGAERALYNLVSHTQSQGLNHRVISLTGPGDYGALLENLDVPVTYWDIKRRPWQALNVFTMRMPTLGPTVVQGWMYHGNLAAILLAKGLRRRRLPLVWNIRHSLDDWQSEGISTRMAIRLNQILCGTVDRIIFNANKSQDQHVQIGIPSPLTTVIANGFDSSVYRPNPLSKTEIRTELGVQEEAVVVCHIGRAHAHKDHGTFFKALDSVLGKNPKVVVFAAGEGVEYSNSALNELIDPKHTSRVHLLGKRDDVPAIMAASNVFVQSSRTEAFPNVLGEAMASGCACVATNVGETKRVLGVTGLVVEPKSPSQLAAAIDHLVTHATERQRLSDLGMAHVQTSYSIDKTNRAYLSLYSDAWASQRLNTHAAHRATDN